MARYSVNPESTPREDDKPWERIPDEGWHSATISESCLGKWPEDSADALSLTFVLDPGGAWVRDKIDMASANGARKIAELVRAVGLDPADFDTDWLTRRPCRVKIRHGKAKRNGDPWVNVVAYAPRNEDPDPPQASELEDLPF